MVRLFNFVKDANVLWKTCIQAKTSIQYLAAKRGLHVRCTLGNTEEGRKKSILAVNYTMFAQNSSTNSQDAKKSRSGRDMSHLSIRHGIEAK